MLYVYAATTQAASCDSLQGIDGSPVEPQRCGPIAVAVSRHELRPEPTATHIAAHHRVTVALAKTSGAVPFRFGSVFEDAEQLRQQLEPRQSELVTKLEQLAGCVEVMVHVRQIEQPIWSSRGRGTRYLLAKKGLAEAERRVNDELSAIVKDCRRSQQGFEVRLACLVEVKRLAELQRRVADLEITGPWAPSSFV
jgi:Gas vesicle synthesis protein GvpL/GvpF